MAIYLCVKNQYIQWERQIDTLKELGQFITEFCVDSRELAMKQKVSITHLSFELGREKRRFFGLTIYWCIRLIEIIKYIYNHILDENFKHILVIEAYENQLKDFTRSVSSENIGWILDSGMFLNK